MKGQNYHEILGYCHEWKSKTDNQKVLYCNFKSKLIEEDEKKKSNSSVHRNPYPLPLLLTKPKDMNTDNRKAHSRRSNSNNRVNCK